MPNRQPILCIFLTLSMIAAPGAADTLARTSVAPAGIEWTPAVAGAGLTVTVSGPDGFYLRRELSPGEPFTFGGVGEDGVARPDGIYVYELRLALTLDEETRRSVEPLRGTGPVGKALIDAGLAPSRTVESGSFAIVDGAVARSEEEIRPTGPNRLAEKATILTISDGTINNSLCVGNNCTSSPPFADSTILVQETTVRLKFDDTSTSSFPDRDWELTANDTGGGVVERFSISDCGTGSGSGCADNEVFSVEAGVRENALYIEDDGEIGVGTANPVADIHIVTGDTPKLRLEQDTSLGFSAQTWEVLGNEAGFIVQDVTAGSFVYPFRIEPGAGPNALVIEEGGQVGLGTLHPTRPLQIVAAGAPDNTVLEISNNGGARIRITNGSSGETWNIGHQLPSQTGLTFSDVGDVDSELLLDVDGNLTITGELTTGGTTCGGGGCDLVFDPETHRIPLAEHAAAMWANGYLPAVGPTPENQPFNLTAKVGGMLHELEMAHIYIEELHGSLEAKGREVAELRARLEERDAEGEVAELRARLERLEAAVAGGAE